MRLVLGTLLAWLALCASASALTELCPASVANFAAASSGDAAGPASAFAYELTALTPRTVDATFLADTDRGWYGWRVGGVPLRAAQLRRGGYQGRGARSAPLEVRLPEPSIVRHAWVARASAPGETIFGWGAAGDTACEVPEYTARAAPAEVSEPRLSAPATTSAATAAEPVPAPFTVTCARPFVAAAAARAAKPTLPKDAFAPGDNPAATIVDVALDERGAVFDAWVAGNAGQVPGFEQSVLSAARLSEYRGAVSYCQSVKSIYTVRLDFQSL